jgi:hypothetical protein
MHMRQPAICRSSNAGKLIVTSKKRLLLMQLDQTDAAASKVLTQTTAAFRQALLLP